MCLLCDPGMVCSSGVRCSLWCDPGSRGPSLCFAAMAKADWLAASGVTLAVCSLRYHTTCGVTLGVR